MRRTLTISNWAEGHRNKGCKDRKRERMDGISGGEGDEEAVGRWRQFFVRFFNSCSMLTEV